MTHAIDIWIWALSGPTAQFDDVLSPDEHARADRFVNPKHGDAYRTGRGRMRQILAEYLGLQPQVLQFQYNAYGKPSLDQDIHFNLSHSGGLACLAMCKDLPLGVDIEAYRAVETGVAERFFSTAEFNSLSALPKDRWNDGFFRCWTRKEAIVKACGPGLSMPLDSFDVTLGPDQPARLLRLEGEDPSGWRLRHIQITPTLVGALAIETRAPIELVLKDAPPELKDQILFE